MKICRYIYGLSVFSLSAIFFSCEKELDFEYHDISPLTVIEGAVTQDGASVRITHTTPMDEPMNRVAVTDARVTVLDITDGTLSELVPDKSGNFIGDQPGVAGHHYRLSVAYDGNEYSATSAMLPSVSISAMEFQWIKMPYDYVAVLQVSFSDDPAVNGDCYWVRVYRNGEAYMWSVIDDVLAVNGQIDEVMMTSRKDLSEEEDDTALRDGDIVSVKVTPVSREIHDYLEAISNGTSNGPQIFSGDFCLGYFLAASVAEASVVFHPDELTEYK